MARKRRTASSRLAQAARIAKPIMSQKEKRDLFFMAFVFLGLGIGGAIAQPGAGLILGVGLGVYGSGMLKDMNTGHLRAPLNRPTYLAILIVFYFIALVLTFVYSKKYPSPYDTSILLLVLGAVLLYLGVKSISKTAK